MSWGMPRGLKHREGKNGVERIRAAEIRESRIGKEEMKSVRAAAFPSFERRFWAGGWAVNYGPAGDIRRYLKD